MPLCLKQHLKESFTNDSFFYFVLLKQEMFLFYYLLFFVALKVVKSEICHTAGPGSRGKFQTF